jgi:alkylation response protein AidB-like acyl-CoA dehydrogenase
MDASQSLGGIMDFSYSIEQLDVKNLAAKIFADKTSQQRLREIDAQQQKFDSKLWLDLAQAGLLAVAMDEKHGGSGFGFETLSLVFEELGRTVAPVPAVPVLTSAYVLQKYANDDICQRYLPAVANGQKMISAALLEPANDNALKPQVLAQYSDQCWTLSGVKSAVPFAPNCEVIIVPASTDKGLAVFLLKPDTDGVLLESQVCTAGEPQYLLTADNAEVELLASGDAASLMVSALAEHMSAALCAMAIGLTDKMMRMTASYTSERQQFGVPVATFQAVGHRAADCYIDVECLRLTTQQAVSLLAQGGDSSEAVMIAKIWVGDVCHRVSQAAQHLHGGIGIDRDYELFRYCLWARQIELTCGTSAALTQGLGEKIAADFLAA